MAVNKTETEIPAVFIHPNEVVECGQIFKKDIITDTFEFKKSPFPGINNSKESFSSVIFTGSSNSKLAERKEGKHFHFEISDKPSISAKYNSGFLTEWTVHWLGVSYFEHSERSIKIQFAMQLR